MTMGKVEERLWSVIRNFSNLGRDHPAMLVNAVRIIELQELVDRSLESSTGGLPSHPSLTCSLSERRDSIFEWQHAIRERRQ
jgi:hypothetical protein